ncbi:hypothetical protein U1437_15540 [Aeromonas caviae]|uniref:hypothetical protein n=1 Tax=Aeromonas caviae TaxID=648 RepID=UPI001FFCB455|nr:hypothetical protein [Aeromonas caviae]MCK2070473.1 hypothetical protein [Aeromonas caviae]
MLTFKTQFPISNEKSTNDVIEAGRVWLAKSPHSTLAELMENRLKIDNDFTLESINESITFNILKNDYDLGAFRHENLDLNGVRWVTEVVSFKEQDNFWISVQLSVDSELPVERVDQGKRPHILKVIMRDIGGGVDGKLKVLDAPHYLSEGDISLAADLITANANCSMPIVYVSANNNNLPHVDPVQLSQWLSGMAHVVVEPTRAFSFELMDEVYNENAYGGAVAIYWPDGIGKWSFLPNGNYSDPREMQISIARKIRSSLLSQRTKSECRWGFVQEQKSRVELKALMASGSKEVEDFIKLFELEIKSKDDEIQLLEAEINRLKYSKRTINESSIDAPGCIVINSSESEIYQAEKIGIIIEALELYRDSCGSHERRQIIISDILSLNNRSDEKDSLLAHMKEILRNYTSMNANIKKALEKIGFDVAEDGKHYKLIFRNETRRPFILSKTGSDHRGGLNSFSDLRKLFF